MLKPLTLIEPPAAESAGLPQNVEAEAALLGALMIDNRLAEDIQLKLRPDHFFEPLHARIYEQHPEAHRSQHDRQPGHACGPCSRPTRR